MTDSINMQKQAPENNNTKLLLGAVFLLLTIMLSCAAVGGMIGLYLSLQQEFATPSTLFETARQSSGPVIEPFDNNANGWETGDFPNAVAAHQAKIVDGALRLELFSAESAYAEKLLPGQTFTDFELTVEATPLDTAEHYSYGLAFRASDTSGYSFEIGNDGLFSLYLFDDEWQSLYDWTSSKSIKVGQTNTLHVKVVGETISLFINGEQVATVTDDALRAGQVGVFVETFEDNVPSAVVKFDNLTVTPVE